MNSRFLERRTFYAGRRIFSEGEQGTVAYIVQSGRVRILKNQASGKKGTLGFVETGGIFGEMALIDSSPRMATAIAEEPSVCIVIPEEILKKKLSKVDPVVKMMLTVLIRLLRTAANEIQLESISLEQLTEQLVNDAVKFEPILKEEDE